MITLEDMADAAVRRGAAWLEEAAPNWRSLINPGTLDIADDKLCVLGQVFGSYYDPATRDARFDESGPGWPRRISHEMGFAPGWAPGKAPGSPEADIWDDGTWLRSDVLTSAWLRYLALTMEPISA